MTIFKRGQHNVAKILCLAAGLAIASVVIAEAYWEETYNDWFSEASRTYLVSETIDRDNQQEAFPQTSGGVAPGLKAACPQIEAATRVRYYQGGRAFLVDGKDVKVNNIQCADNEFFDVFPQKQLAGDLKKGLSTYMGCVISRSFAERIGGNVVGKMLVDKFSPETKFTIYGVFDDFPSNSTFGTCQMYVSMEIFAQSKDERRVSYIHQLIGGDSFGSYIRLRKGVTIDDLQPNVKCFIDSHEEYAETMKQGVKMGYTFATLNEEFTKRSDVHTMIIILSILAVVLLLSAVMNYLLIIVGNLPRRFREMAVRKCFGAKEKTLYGIVFREAFSQVLIAIVLAAAFLFVCKGTIQQLTSAPLSDLFYSRVGWILLAVCILIVAFGTLVPGWLYNRIPVATAFRGLKDGRHPWKRWLLAVEFASAGLLFCLLIVVQRQYNLMINDNPGYDYQNTLIVSISNTQPEERQKAIDLMERMPEIAGVSSCYTLPYPGVSGNDVSLPGSDQSLINVGDMYWTGDYYFETMGIKCLVGGFTEHADSSSEVMISERLAKKMKVLAHWPDNPIGQRMVVTEHNGDTGQSPFCTVVGVYKDFRLGNITSEDDRPSLMFHSNLPGETLLARYHELKPESIEDLQAKLKKLYPGDDKEVSVWSWLSDLEWLYTPQRNFRTGTAMAGITVLLIALMGLVGYSNDEVNRRRKEIAIRKVNGAHTRDILQLFLRGIFWVALPSLVVGAVFAYVIAGLWLQSFSVKTPLSPCLFLACVIVLLAVVLATVAINCYKVANSNPVEYLKQE